MFYMYYIAVELQDGESLHARNHHSLAGRNGLEDTSLERLGYRADGLLI
jgi:hypothetical protein